MSADPAPDNCAFDPVDETEQAGASLSLDVDCNDGSGATRGATFAAIYSKYAYSTLLDAASGRPLPHFERFAYGSLEQIGDHELLQHVTGPAVTDVGLRVIDSGTGRVLWNVSQRATRDGTREAQISGGAGLVVVTDTYASRITVYRAADAKQLWQHAFGTTGHRDVDLTTAAMVIGGQVRVVVGLAAPFQVVTFDSAGQVEGSQDLPMFDRGGNPAAIGGDYGTLVVEDITAAADEDSPVPPYVLLTR
jgi:hypothetical protein